MLIQPNRRTPPDGVPEGLFSDIADSVLTEVLRDAGRRAADTPEARPAAAPDDTAREGTAAAPLCGAPRRRLSTEEQAEIQRLIAREAGEDLPSGLYVQWLKPLMDVVLAAVLLVLTAPVLLAGMLAVRTWMGPGVLFRQQRIGQHGRVFTVLKLRTMRHDRRTTTADDLEAFAAGRWDGIDRRRTHKTEADPRHTQIGRWLRRLSVDELPQLLNVLRGEMSLVGPRPELPVVVERHYEPWMHRRHLVKPGITGLWQVSMRGEGAMHEHADIDVDYVDRVSFRQDLSILLATPLAALSTRQGS